MMILAGACDVLPCSALEIDERAHLIVEACGFGPREQPAGRDCHAAMVAVWATETAKTLNIYPDARGNGCGPVQVIPLARWGNTRRGRGPTPPCDGLRVPRVGLAWGVRVLRAKAIRLGWSAHRAVFRAYNGSQYRDRYARTADRIYRRLVK
jgi:hypothetical protein